jgi:Polyketide cyclase / dehydrase and lipid transport
MLRYEARSNADPDVAWALVARPARWHEWAPHVRGAWGLGEPEVTLGARGAARLFGVVPVPAAVVAKTPGRAWTWRVGPVELDHRVEPRAAGCLVGVDVRAPAPLEAALRVSYGPLVALLVRRLARVAERGAADVDSRTR